jgi:hypothetical protein
MRRTWSTMQRGDWCLEERLGPQDASYGTFLCVLNHGEREQAVKLPEDLVLVLKQAGVTADISKDFD